MEETLSHLYIIQNEINKKIYFGITTQNPPNKRWNQHLTNSKLKRGNWHMYSSMRKYGTENFQFKILVSKPDLNEIAMLEYLLIQLFETQNKSIGYNLADGGIINRGYHIPEEVNVRHSESMMGEKNHFYGKKHTNETKILLSMANLGRRHSEESKLKMIGRKGNMLGVTGKNHPAYGRVRPESERLSIQLNTPHRREILMIDKDTDEILMDFLSKKHAGRWLYDNQLCKNSQSKSVASNITKGIKENKPRYGYKWEEIDKSQSTIESSTVCREDSTGIISL